MSLFTDIDNWSMHCGIRTSYDATVNLINKDKQYGSALRWTPFQVTTTASVLHSSLADVTCFEGSKIWVYGIVLSVDDTRELYEIFCSLKIGSFAARLGKKPVNTEKYDFADTSAVLAELASTYGGLGSAVYDFSPITGDGKIYAVISGNNILEEMKKVAQTAKAYLFVDETGILTAKHWKDNTSGVDIVIPPQAINSAAIGRDTSIIPSQLTVRGRYVSQFDCGDQVLSSEDWDNPFTPQSFRPHDKQGQLKKCAWLGVGQVESEIILGKLRGSKEDLRNATYVVSGDAEFSFTTAVKDNTVRIALSGPSSAYLSQGNKEFDVKVTGKMRPKNEYVGANSQMGPLRSSMLVPGTILGRMARNLTGLPMAEWPEDLLKGPDKDKTADEPDPLRIEMVVNDSDLQAEFGVVTEQLENLYVFDYETLFNIAVRQFQEYKMKRNTWKVNCMYLPCLELNQVVTFTTPDGEEVTGLLTDIEIQYDSTPKMGMGLVIEAFDDIGSTTYNSSNLFLYPELCGTSNSAYAWNNTSTGDSYCDMMGGYVALGGTPSGVAALWQGFDLEIGEEYTLTYELILDSGGSIVVGVVGLTSQVHVGTGSYSLVFTPTVKYNVIYWQTDTGDWYMARPKLVKEVIR